MLLIEWVVQRRFERTCLVDAAEVVALCACCSEFLLDVFRAERQHMALTVGALEFCGVKNCIVHEQWTAEDVQFVERADSVVSSLT